FEDAKFLKSIQSLVRSLSISQEDYEDLMQEARIYLWQIQEIKPDKTSAWYRKGCLFFLKHHLRRKRASDALEHCARDTPLRNADGILREGDESECDDSLMSIILAHEIIALLSARLGNRERLIFEEMNNGV